MLILVFVIEPTIYLIIKKKSIIFKNKIFLIISIKVYSIIASYGQSNTSEQHTMLHIIASIIFSTNNSDQNNVFFLVKLEI